MRQPLNVVSVQPLSKPFELHKNMQSAKRSAERLDEEAANLVQATYMGFISRWARGVNLTSLKKQYSQDLLSHLHAMTVLMKSRRELGGFKKLREFDFQNMIRKSDYLLALPVAKMSIEVIAKDSKMSEHWKKVLTDYNHERMIFDSQKITVAKN